MSNNIFSEDTTSSPHINKNSEIKHTIATVFICTSFGLTLGISIYFLISDLVRQNELRYRNDQIEQIQITNHYEKK